jgi:hypothetical protein
MSVSRRQFLHNTALAAIGCATSSGLVWGGSKKFHGPASGSSSIIAGPLPGRQAFEGQVGSSFEFTSEAGLSPGWLQLAGVGDLPKLVPVNPASMAVPPPKTKGPTANTSGFVLSFSRGPAAGLAQGTYTVQNQALGKFSLFIVPTGPGSQSYTAVFNQLK